MVSSSNPDIFRRRPLPQPPRGSIGFFEALPLEAVYALLEWIPLEDAGNLGLTCERLRILISEWSRTGPCLLRVRASKKHLLPFSVLVKRVTTLLSTKERVRFMTYRFHECLLRRAAQVHKVPKSLPWRMNHHYSVDYFVHFGVMLFKFIRGWDEMEYTLLFSALDKMFSITARIDKWMNFISASPGSFFCPQTGRVSSREIQHTERQLRLILRSLWWDLSEKEFGSRGDWLLANINHFLGPSPFKQAVFIYLMLGPTLESFDRPLIDSRSGENGAGGTNDYYTNVDWSFMSTHTPTNFHEGIKIFNRIAQCICHLSHSSSSWRKNRLIEVLNCLFGLPNGWMRDNIAGFLLFCNERVLLDYLFMKLDVATSQELDLSSPAKLLVDIMMESYKFDNEIIHGRGVGVVLDKVLRYVNNALRGEFFDTIWDQLLAEIEQSADNIPIDEVIIGFGRFMSKRSIYVLGKRKFSSIGGPKSSSKNLRAESSSEEGTHPSDEVLLALNNEE